MSKIPKKAHPALPWSGSVLALAALILALLVSGSFAAYTSLNTVRRVVSTMAGSGTMFSSNYMSLWDSGATAYGTKSFAYNETEDAPAFTVTVCNYAQDNPKYVNGSDITYTLTATLVDREGNAYDTSKLTAAELACYKVNNTAFVNGTATLTGQTLSGGTKSKISYTITMDSVHMSEVYVLVKAVPVADSLAATDNKILACKFRGTVSNAQRSAGWSGSFTDAKVDSEPSALDGFNYEITGYGVGTITLTWDSTKVAISPWFLADEGVSGGVTTSGGKSSVTFSVSAKDSSFRLQFYRVAAASADETSDMVRGYVTCRYEPETSTATPTPTT
jgi:hypothetical protein